MLRSLWPGWFEENIASLEREAKAAGQHCVWGEPPPGDDGTVHTAGRACANCPTRQAMLLEAA